MTDDERQRMMDFILEQQAQFSVEMHKIQESHAAADKRMGNLEKGFVKLYNFLNDTAKLSRENAEQIKELKQSVAETNARVDTTNERLEETNERLNAFIFVLETDIASRSKSRNGNGAKKPSSRATKKRRDGSK